METVEQKELIKGAEFLTKNLDASQIFIPEEFEEEQQMIAQSCIDFVEKEVTPILDKIDKAESPQLMSSLLDKAGELGFLATAVPVEYEGFGMSFNSSMLVSQAIGGGHSFAVALSAHTGIGTLPILYYGTEKQKQKYLPKLAIGEWKACYCLTEPDAGSDANAGKTKATLSEDEKYYIINGQKMWITNAGFAEVFIVFAKIDDDKNLTAFIIEKDFGGITMNEPENKLGIKGSDTRQVFFNDCKVPVENMLSERGNGFKIAVNILNIGRIKLATSNLGSARQALNHAIQYANERKQFGIPIASFGAIQHKLAESAIRIFAVESAAYRAGQNIDDAIEAFIANGMEEATAKLKSFEQFAIECAMMKVAGSEMLDYVVDETVQVFGGMGYSADAPAERHYRDSRINRIFEGTNEINRILSISTVLKRAIKGELDIMQAATQAIKEGKDVNIKRSQAGVLVYEKALVSYLKKATLLITGAAAQTLGAKFKEEQEIALNLADMLIYTYLAESVILRAEKLMGMKGESAVNLQIAMAKTYLAEAADNIYKAGKNALVAFAEGENYQELITALRDFTETIPFNVKNARREVAGHLIKENKYSF